MKYYPIQCINCNCKTIMYVEYHRLGLCLQCQSCIDKREKINNKMLYKINDTTYSVTWVHHNNVEKVNELKNKKHTKLSIINFNLGELRSYTECLIRTFPDNVQVSNGMALLSSKEKNYNKRVGRKISFINAIKNMDDITDLDKVNFYHELEKLSSKYADTPSYNVNLK